MKIKNSMLMVLLLVAFSFGGNQAFGQHQDSVRYNQYGQKVNRKPMTIENRNGILVFESPDQNFRTWFDLRINFDGAYYFDKNALNPLGNGLTIRRLRFAMKTVLYDRWTGEVDLDFAGGELDVKDAFIGYKWDDHKMNLKAGYFKEPISMETTTTSRYQTFVEEPYVTTFAPQRQLGVNITKWDKSYMGFLGVHFNDVENIEVTTYTKDANKDYGTDEGISVTGKAVVRPVNAEGKLVHVGVSGSYRTPKTSWEFEDTYRISTRDMTNISRKKYLDTDDIPNVDSHVLFGGELSASLNNFKFSSEYIYSKINRKADNPDYEASGSYASLSCLLFGGKYNYNSEEGEFTQVTRGNDWGDVEVALRYDYINLNDTKAQIMGGSASGFTAGITYHINYNAKLMLNYTYINHDRYASGKGKLFVGTDESGELTKDYTRVTEKDGKAGDDYGFLQARFELDF